MIAIFMFKSLGSQTRKDTPRVRREPGPVKTPQINSYFIMHIEVQKNMCTASIA